MRKIESVCLMLIIIPNVINAQNKISNAKDCVEVEKSKTL